jgi:uncharacterized protein with ParB-like and HNH nuclease domain
MSVVFENIKHLTPVQTNIKTRNNGSFLIVCSLKLDILHLNYVAKDFYQLVDGKQSLEAIYLTLLGEYDVGADVLKSDISNLVRDMQWQAILNLKNC